MKKTVFTLLAISAFGVAGCNSKPQAQAPAAPAQQQAQAPAAGQPGGDPHAGVNMKTQELPAGKGVKATVAQTMNSGGYTYAEVSDDKGQKVWLALPETKLAKGDVIEYPGDAMPMTNFKSKTLNRTFDKILFVSSIRIDKK